MIISNKSKSENHHNFTFPNISETDGRVELSANLNRPYGSIRTNVWSCRSLEPPATVVEGATGRCTANNSGTFHFAVNYYYNYIQ